MSVFDPNSGTMSCFQNCTNRTKTDFWHVRHTRKPIFWACLFLDIHVCSSESRIKLAVQHMRIWPKTEPGSSKNRPRTFFTHVLGIVTWCQKTDRNQKKRKQTVWKTGLEQFSSISWKQYWESENSAKSKTDSLETSHDQFVDMPWKQYRGSENWPKSKTDNPKKRAKTRFGVFSENSTTRQKTDQNRK